MKRAFVILVSLFSLTFVSAQSSLGYALSTGMQNLIATIEVFLGPLFAALLGGDGNFLLGRVLFFIVIAAVVFRVTSKMDFFGNKAPLIWIVTLSVSLLSTRYLVESSLIQAMILPYSAFGIAISSAIPLIIYFTFVQSIQDSAVLRKFLWIGFIVVFLGIWSARTNDGAAGQFAWIYLITAVAALIFLLMDGTIRRWRLAKEFQDTTFDGRMKNIGELRKRLQENEDDHANNRIPTPTYKRVKKKLLKQIEDNTKG